MPHRTYLNWSSGKDSAMALYQLLRDDRFRTDYLLTSVNAHYDRVSMHGLRRAVLERQLERIGIPHGVLELPELPTNEEYETRLAERVRGLKADGYACAAFGDLFLEDLRQYRERQMAALGLRAVFPLWHRPTRPLIEEFLALGFRAVIACVNGQSLDASFAGRELDASLLRDLPAGVDPCGENGEFHTFCYDGPIFREPVPFTPGETVQREYEHNGAVSRFWFCDLE